MNLIEMANRIAALYWDPEQVVSTEKEEQDTDKIPEEDEKEGSESR